MDGTVYQLGSRMNDLAEMLQVVATNVANANTIGFKRIVAAVQGGEDAGAGETDGLVPDPSDWPRLDGLRLDLSSGPIRNTGRPLDLALQGEGFFVLETEAGERFTRKGRLYLSREGELTDASGNRYASDSGSLSIPAGTRAVSVSKTGEVAVDGTPIGKLRLVTLPDAEGLVPEGAGVYAYEGARPEDATQARVIQGAVEESNVQAVG
jgi:flagellar basal-body rod protein FlgF